MFVSPFVDSKPIETTHWEKGGGEGREGGGGFSYDAWHKRLNHVRMLVLPQGVQFMHMRSEALCVQYTSVQSGTPHTKHVGNPKAPTEAGQSS